MGTKELISQKPGTSLIIGSVTEQTVTFIMPATNWWYIYIIPGRGDPPGSVPPAYSQNQRTLYRTLATGRQATDRSS